VIVTRPVRKPQCRRGGYHQKSGVAEAEQRRAGRKYACRKLCAAADVLANVSFLHSGWGLTSEVRRMSCGNPDLRPQLSLGYFPCDRRARRWSLQGVGPEWTITHGSWAVTGRGAS
jgi:hypothetical protein